jgi:hypothetical protein
VLEVYGSGYEYEGWERDEVKIEETNQEAAAAASPKGTLKVKADEFTDYN